MASGWFTEGKRAFIQDAAYMYARVQPVSSTFFFDQSMSSIGDADPYTLGGYKEITFTYVTNYLTDGSVEISYNSPLQWVATDLPQTGSVGGFLFYYRSSPNQPFFYLELDQAFQLNGNDLTLNFTGSYLARI